MAGLEPKMPKNIQDRNEPEKSSKCDKVGKVPDKGLRTHDAKNDDANTRSKTDANHE